MLSLRILILIVLSVFNPIASQSACIWGNHWGVNGLINGEYQWQGEFDGNSWYRRDRTRNPEYPSVYLWRIASGEWLITATPPNITTSNDTSYASPGTFAHCIDATDDPWQCGENQWEVRNGTGFQLHPEVYGLEHSCPEWPCDAIMTPYVESDCDSFETKIGENAWRNKAGNLYWWFSPTHFSWACTKPGQYYSDNLTVWSWVGVERGWVDIELGGYAELEVWWPENTTYLIQCINAEDIAPSTTSIEWSPSNTTIVTATEAAIPISNVLSLHITVAIWVVFMLFTLTAWIDARVIRRNDYFFPMCVVRTAVEVCDTVFDVLFAVLLLLNYLRNEQKTSGLFIACVASFAFIVISLCFGVYQLAQTVKSEWSKDDKLAGWLKNHGRLLFIFSLIAGSAFAACEIVNCGAFQLEMFMMGLNKQERIQFNAKRVVGVVFLENVPSLLIQIWFLTEFGMDFLPVLAVIFSSISIVLILVTIYLQWTIIRNQNTVCIGFDVTDNAIEFEPNLSTNTNGIRRKSAVLFGVKENLMEIQQPSIIPQGLRVEMFLFVNETNLRRYSYHAMIHKAVRNKKMGNIIMTEWNLPSRPRIDNITFSIAHPTGYGMELQSVWRPRANAKTSCYKPVVQEVEGPTEIERETEDSDDEDDAFSFMLHGARVETARTVPDAETAEMNPIGD